MMIMYENNLEESNKLEYKSNLPENNVKWLKTIVSFSNTSGGKLIIGIEDETKRIVGINTSRSKLETKIMDTIYNSIEPVPIVNLSFKNVEDKDVLIIHVSKGNETPYYIKSAGMYEGCYVRFGSTDRVATNALVHELVLNSKRQSFTSSIYDNNVVSNKEISEFLSRLNKSNSHKKINIKKLEEWQLIIKQFDDYYASNGYMLLTSNPFPTSVIKLGLFEGTNKARMLDEEIFEGDIINQYDGVIDRILELLSKGFNFSRIRIKEYTIPQVVIREIVANAVIHRNYSDQHPIRIEIFSDRISVISPGALYDGLQLEDMLSGVSKLRNQNIAEIFYSLGYIEKWGSGIQRSNQILEEHQMFPLEIDAESIHGVTVTIYYEKMAPYMISEQKIPTPQIVKEYYKKSRQFTRKSIEKDFNITERQARTILEKLLEDSQISKRGSGPKTFYVIIG